MFERPAARHAVVSVRSGTTAELLARGRLDDLVRSFHADVQNDDLPGPILAARVPHMERMTALWSSLL